MATPTVVLIHGAFADAASWAPVTRELLDRGVEVLAPANPLRTLSGDAEAIRRAVESVDGPVVLVGHSYGGAVITVAGMADNVVGLVYVAGYVPDEGESAATLDGKYPASDLRDHLVALPYTTTDGKDDVDLTVEAGAFLPVFAAGLDARLAEVLAVSQRAFAGAAYNAPASVTAWKSKPCWGIVAADDHTIQPETERFGYERAKFRSVVEINAPHLAMQTHPKDVADVIETAVRETASA